MPALTLLLKTNAWWIERTNYINSLTSPQAAQAVIRDKRHERDSSILAYKVVVCYNGLSHKEMYGSWYGSV